MACRESLMYNYTQSGPAVPRAMQMQPRVGLLSIDPDRSIPLVHVDITFHLKLRTYLRYEPELCVVFSALCFAAKRLY